MDRRLRHPRSAYLGWLILLLLAGIAATTFFVDRLDPRTEPVYALVVLVPETPRLRSGAPVWVAGREVGRITRVDLPRGGTGPQDIGLIVTAEIRQHVQEMIRRDSQARVARDRLLSPPGINIAPGSIAEPVLQHGDTLRVEAAVDYAVYVRRTARLAAALDSLRATVVELAPRARRGEARFRSLDEDISRVRAEADLIARALREGAGAGRMRDPELRASIERVRATVTEISALVRDRRLELAPARDRLLASLQMLQEEIATIEGIFAEDYATLPRLSADTALREALRQTRTEIDRLIGELTADPLRLFF